MKNRPKKKLLILVIGIMTLIFGVALVLSLNALSEHKRMNETGIETTAVIVRIDYYKIKKGMTGTYGAAEYLDKQGNSHLYENTFPGRLSIGSEVTLVYDSENPDKVVNKDDIVFIRIIVIISGIMVLITLSLLIYCIIFSAGRKDMYCLHQNISDEELSGIVAEYMPKTIERFRKKGGKMVPADKITADPVMENALRSGDPVGGIYQSQKQIYKIGSLYLGAVIKPLDPEIYSESIDLSENAGRTTVPAFMVYTDAPYFKERPADLKRVADAVGGNVSFGIPLSENDLQIINYLSANTSRPFNIGYNGTLSMGHNVYITTVILDKHHLCNAKLSNKLLYVIAAPGQTEYAAVLPAWYYSPFELSVY